MTFRTVLKLLLMASALGGVARAQAPSNEETASLLLGTKLFDNVCRESVGNPQKFHALVDKAGLAKLPPDQTSQGETWAGSVGGVSVAVQYTKTMTCFVYMSHAREQDVRMHIIKLIKGVFRQGDSTVAQVPTESRDSSILRFNVAGPSGKYMLMALYRPGEPSLARSALVIGPFQ